MAFSAQEGTSPSLSIQRAPLLVVQAEEIAHQRGLAAATCGSRFQAVAPCLSQGDAVVEVHPRLALLAAGARSFKDFSSRSIDSLDDNDSRLSIDVLLTLYYNTDANLVNISIH